ncbi:MAG: glutamate--cysteine ligase [Myxococcota bacterium]|nr:glutamate--cysteine ligase [Myxococcota bacterium]
MGLEVDRESFDDADYVAFDARLQACLDALAELMARPGFGVAPLSLGAEVELDLIDAKGDPFPKSREILAAVNDPRVTLEIDRFNLEINASPVALVGSPFAAIGLELGRVLSAIGKVAASHHGARALAIGILPSLRTEHVQSPALITDRPRYRALGAGLRRLRYAPFQISISGTDHLEIECEDVTMEGANTSLQIHLRVPPQQFAAMHHAAQIATAPVLAVSGNSPLLLGKRLWEETRIALFRQSVDDRPLGEIDEWRPSRVSFGHGWVRTGAHELFAESVALYEPLLPIVGPEDPLACVRGGGVPTLAELRLHHGTVWRWNRAVYDPAADGHLRIELRSLPSGPTVRDMMANAAFLVGLVLAIAPEIEGWLPGLTFGHARRNFYSAARRGLAAELLWPAAAGERVRAIGARELAERLLPVARAGLLSAGVDPEDADRHLDLIAGRLTIGQTGSVWQRRVFEDALRTTDADEAGRVVARTYGDASADGTPVHEWGRP